MLFSNCGHTQHETVEQVRSFVKNTILKVIVLGAAVGVALSIFGGVSLGLGLFSGAILSAVNFKFMSMDSFSMVNSSSPSAGSFMTLRYIMRYTVILLTLILIAKKTNFNIVAVCAGLFFVQIVLIVGRFIENIRFFGKSKE